VQRRRLFSSWPAHSTGDSSEIGRACVPDDRRSEREGYNHALIRHFVAQLMPGAQFQRVPRDPPDYIVDAAVGRIGIELTEVQPEHVPDGAS
jgi:hypothetical protein